MPLQLTIGPHYAWFSGHFLKTWKSIYSASTEQCSILENLFPGDITLADRGFTVEDAVGLIVLKLLLLLSVLI